MRLAQATFFEWVAALLVCALERSVLRLTALLNCGMLRRFGWLAPQKGERTPPQPGGKKSRFPAPQTAPLSRPKVIPFPRTNIPLPSPLIFKPDIALFV